MRNIKVIGFSGSLRKDSYTTKLVKAFAKSAPDGITLEIIDISQLPLINQDLEDDLPQSVLDLHKAIKGADAVLLASPEYNRSYSPVIKNAIDWGSRPQGQNSWDSKPVAIIGCSPYTLGGFGAVHHLRQVVSYVNMFPLQQPEFYLSGVADKMDDSGNITDKETQDFIDNLWKKFGEWIEKLT